MSWLNLEGVKDMNQEIKDTIFYTGSLSISKVANPVI